MLLIAGESLSALQAKVGIDMEEQRFANGALVQLRSGGPQMTVKNFGDYMMGAKKNHYLCTWFDAKGQRQEDTFAEHELEAVEAGTGSVRIGRA